MHLNINYTAKAIALFEHQRSHPAQPYSFLESLWHYWESLAFDQQHRITAAVTYYELYGYKAILQPFYKAYQQLSDDTSPAPLRSTVLEKADNVERGHFNRPWSSIYNASGAATKLFIFQSIVLPTPCVRFFFFNTFFSEF